ncbi:unnamed protein product, partial [Dibothriocephalus latus]
MAEDGGKYPEINQRGFYSDILAENVTEGQTLGELEVPVVDNITDDSRLLASTPNVSTNSYLKDFTAASYEPKVQVPFYTPPGKCPRKLVIERKKREFEKYNLVRILEEEYKIETKDLMPRPPANFKDEDGNWCPYLFLDIFDDEDYDCRTPSDWLSLGLENSVRKPVPAVALLPVRDDKHDSDMRNPELSWAWQRVGVLDYEPKSKQWLVQKSDACNRVLDDQKNPVVNGGLQPTGHFTKMPTQYWVPRIQIRFIAEDPVVFAKRIATAYRSREDTEAAIRYNLYLDCMPTEGLVEMDQAALKRIKYLAKDSTPVLKKKTGLDAVTHQLEKEIIIDHWRSMNDLILRKFVADNPGEYSFIRPPKYPKKEWPWKGTVEIPRYDFVIKFDEFAFHTLFGKPEAIVANCTAQFECLEARSRLLLHMPVVKP